MLNDKGMTSVKTHTQNWNKGKLWPVSNPMGQNVIYFQKFEASHKPKPFYKTSLSDIKENFFSINFQKGYHLYVQGSYLT